MTKPYIIIHTHTSIDGNIDIMDIPAFYSASQIYQDLSLNPDRQVFNIPAYLNGKTSTEDHITHYQKPQLDLQAPPVPAGDYVANDQAPMYYLSIDWRGELAFEANTFGYGGVDSHIVQILTDQTSNAYKAFLREREISYIIAGQDQLDYDLMLDKLSQLFGIQRLMIGGGGTINWSFLQANLVDEISTVIAPIANADPEGHRFFVAKPPYSAVEPHAFNLKDLQAFEDGTVWIRYTVAKEK